MKGAPTIISASSEEISQDVVFIWGTDQLFDWQPQFLGVPAGQNVAKVPSWHGEVDCIAKFDLALFHQLTISGEIVDNLWNQPADVHWVGRGELVAIVDQALVKGLVVKDLLDLSLGIVKITLNSYSGKVLPRLPQHLL